MQNEKTTLSKSEISAMIGKFSNVIELAVLDVVEYEPSRVFATVEDLICDATLAVMLSLQSFEKRYVSAPNLVAWIRQRARWSTMNSIKSLAIGNRIVRSCGTLAGQSNEADRQRDMIALQRAMATLDSQSANIMNLLIAGHDAGQVAKKMKLSDPTISRRKQVATEALTAAMAS